MRKQFLRLIMLILSLIISIPLNAVDNLRAVDIRSISMGGNGVTQSFYYNPSLISFRNERQLSLDYINRYNVQELGTLSASFLYPTSTLSTGVNIASFGFNDYRETLFRIGMSRQLNPQWHLGVAFHYTLLQSTLHEENIQRVGIDVGAVYNPVETMLIGVSIINLPDIYLSGKAAMNKQIERYKVETGFEWEFINNMLIASSVNYTEEHGLGCSLGMEYEPFSHFSLRSGISVKPLIPSFGVGYRVKSFDFNVVALYHSMLGVSSGLGMKYSF